MTRILWISVLCALLAVQSAEGWGSMGHMIIGQLAWDRLSSTAQSVANSFLGTQSMAEIAPLADSFRETPEGAWSEPCHFCNLPKGATNFTMKYCPGFCVVKSIMNYTKILASEASNPFQCDYDTGVEPCALEFLVHFAGDAHQPLHVSYAYDRGGNDVKVDFYGTSTNLHAVWDTKIIEQWDTNWTDAVSQLEQIMQSEPSTIKHYLRATNPITWADESFGYVLSTVYNFTDSEYSMRGEPQLGDTYYHRNLPIVQQRLIAAGVRLGAILNKLFDPKGEGEFF